MFGKLVPIKDAFPNYMLDFQERADARPDSRWVDRLTTDGTWSGNLFDFYALAIQRLFRDLRVPFQLRGDTRIDETPVHEALREALVNTLIHADYTGRVSVLVVKRSDLFAFRNPGAMRMPVETALRGGVSDCRNRRLQDMFRYVGLGEQAGSGIPKIQSAWRTQHWRSPEMVEQVEPYEQTIFTLRMASLLPTEVVQALEQRFGTAFDQASEVQKLALVTAAVERSVTHARLRSMTDLHPRDVTVALSSLVQRGMLESGGAHKRTFYFLPGERPTAEVTPVSFELPLPGLSAGGAKVAASAGSVGTPQVTPQVTLQVTPQVVTILQSARKPKSRAELQKAAGLRDRDHFRQAYLEPLIEAGFLAMTAPDKPRSSQQRYFTTPAGEKLLERERGGA